MSTLPMIEEPFHELAAWVACLAATDLPVLAETADALEAMRAHEDEIDANRLGELIATDPLMTLKVLAHASAVRSPRVVTDIETVTGALVMMGIPPFFRAFGRQPVIGDVLAGRPAALAAVESVLSRSRRASHFALAFAVHRMEPSAPLIHAAALLHDFAELLLWCRAPALATRVAEAQRLDTSLRSSVAQRHVLHIELVDLQQALMRKWQLPRLLTRISDDRHADKTDVQCVVLATRLARHTAHGWDNPALPDDITELAALLNLSPAASLEFARSV